MATAGLRYSDDSEPGYSRRACGRGWVYRSPDGQTVKDSAIRQRLNALAMPPAYKNVWYCLDENGHLQATGLDDRGRKQYRYHPDFRAQQETDKFSRCAEFGQVLPNLRARVEEDLGARALSQARMVAAVIRLLDLGLLRVGNEDYAAANKSFGATTLRKRHGKVRGNALYLHYRAKSGKDRRLKVADRSLALVVRRCQDLPGQHLFRYEDEEGGVRPVTSGDVNAYIQEVMGSAFSAKHFRTWGASVIAFQAIVESGGDVGLKSLLRPVASQLGNTEAISRKSYVHPALIEAVKEGRAQEIAARPLPREARRLSRMERGLIEFLAGSQ
jgi:DNA topoisomerase-1